MPAQERTMLIAACPEAHSPDHTAGLPYSCHSQKSQHKRACPMYLQGEQELVQVLWRHEGCLQCWSCGNDT